MTILFYSSVLLNLLALGFLGDVLDLNALGQRLNIEIFVDVGEQARVGLLCRTQSLGLLNCLLL
jgi:hypothetical protein